MDSLSFWRRNDLSALLLASIFMNGFETGGYQAALLYVGQEYDLSIGQQGILASVQLFATMIAPLLLGALADRIGKKIMLVVFTAIRVLSAAIILLATDSLTFAVGIFVLGFSCSIVQYVAIAGMQDAYPITRNRRMGFITAMFALGAVVAPLLVGFCLTTSWGWQGFFLVSGIVFFFLTVLLWRTGFEPRETAPAAETVGGGTGIYVKGVALLCFIMFIYVGVENGVCFFLNNFLLDTMNSTRGYLALSLFWLAMIPSRFLCGFLAKYRSRLIVLAPLGATIMLAILTLIRSESLAFVIVFVLGFFCGGVYPNVLTYVADFASGRTATVTAAITVATGVGATIISASFGFLHDSLGFSGAFLALAALLGVDIFVALLVPRLHR
ncbi:Fucose permease [Selenomonas sp. WCT3]|uniref:MFS transporter n=1 Tax=Selenomonas sp. WCT3 TaxID=3158785 RepID=UPI000880981F|nr:Fucose permease [Selenomonas ruminantium]